MYHPSIIALLTVPLALVSAVTYPTNTTNKTATVTTTSTTNTTTTLPEIPDVPTEDYYLITQVLGDGNEDKNGLYVSGYHTGAGVNDVTLGPIDVASKAFLNGTYMQFDYDTAFPWGMKMGNDLNYAAWEFAMIDTGYGSEGFFFNASGLQWNETDGGFIGWLACDWWHGVPQLFWLYYELDFALPSSCAQVDLFTQGVDD